MPTAPLNLAYDTHVSHDLAVLTTLAHLGWLTTEQLHTLCFADRSRPTVRLTLRTLAHLGWLTPIRWRIGPGEGGQLWAVLPKDVEQVQRYQPVVAPCVPRDLGRPSSALERAEWVAQCSLQTFVVTLIQSARQSAVLSQLGVALPPWSPDQNCLTPPDACLSIVWSPAQRQVGAWLPWSEHALDATPAVRYQFHIVRAGDPDPARLVPPPGGSCDLAILVFATADHCAQTQACLLDAGTVPVRLAPWAMLGDGLNGPVGTMPLRRLHARTGVARDWREPLMLRLLSGAPLPLHLTGGMHSTRPSPACAVLSPYRKEGDAREMVADHGRRARCGDAPASIPGPLSRAVYCRHAAAVPTRCSCRVALASSVRSPAHRVSPRRTPSC